MNHSFNVQLAQVYGIPGAILIQHFDFWLTKNRANGKHFKDGAYWTYCSLDALSVIFPYLSKRQIKYAIQKLKQADVIKVEQFNKTKHDQTNWYAFTDTFLKSPCSSMVQFCLIDDPKMVAPEGTKLSHRIDDNVPSLKGSDVITDIKTDVAETFKHILTCLKRRVNEPSFNTWLRPMKILRWQDSQWVIGVPDATFVYWLDTYYTKLLQEIIKEVTGQQVSIEFRVELPN